MKELYKFNVKSGDVSVDFVFAAPSRSVLREGEMVYARTYAECTRNGLLTNAEALKLANERGGVFTPDEKEEYLNSLKGYFEKDKAAKELLAKGEPAGDLLKEAEELKSKVVYFQGKQDAVLDYTAETKARDALLLFNALSLTMKDGKPYFDGKDASTKLKLIEDADDFHQAVLSRAIYYATALFYNVKDLNEDKAEDASTESSTPTDNKA